MKKKYILFSILAVLLILITIAAIRITTQRLASRAVQSQDYKKLETICSFPIKNLDGIVAYDFLAAIVEERGLYTPLELACENGDLEATKILLKHGANPNYQHQFDTSRYNCLETAIISGNLKMIELLIESGADIQESALRGVDTLIRYGSRKKLSLDEFKELYLYLNKIGACLKPDDLIDAVGLGADIEVLQWLIIDNGISIDSRNKKGQTFLHLCCLSGIVKTDTKELFVRYCLDNKADLSLVDENGKTAFDYALEKETGTFAELVRP